MSVSANRQYRRATIDGLSTRFGGAVKLVRKDLGITAFGAQIFELPPGASSLRHAETGTGQEELYVNLGGSGWLIVGEERVEFGPRTVIYVDPTAERNATAGEKGLSYLCVGAPREGPYVPLQKFS
jgi:uncharacterized cupin superfamily protein